MTETGAVYRAGNSKQLTDKEIVILQYLLEGKNNKEIALILGVDASTIRYHKICAERKLGASNTIQTVLAAYVLGYLSKERLLQNLCKTNRNLDEDDG